MAWELLKVEEQRKDLVNAYISGASMTELAKRYKVSRKTAYKWYKRFLQEGELGLINRPKKPHRPSKAFDEECINLALDMKLRYRKWGPKKILALLQREYPDRSWPCQTRLYQIFKEHHLVTSRRLRKRVPATHPLGEVNGSNDVWMADFKGDIYTKDGGKTIPLTVSDGYSRYLLHCEHLPKRGGDYVWPIFEALFKEHGLPNRIRTDNGSPFGSRGAGRLTPLSVKFIQAGVLPEWINPGHPEENGQHERMHLTLKQAIASPPPDTAAELINQMKAFQEEFNYKRPHEALEMKTPSDFYSSNTRPWDGVLRPPEYDTRECEVRKVCPSGCVWLSGNEYYVNKTIIGEYVSLRQTDSEDIDVHYGPVYLGKLSKGNRIQTPKLKTKKIIRRQ